MALNSADVLILGLVVSATQPHLSVFGRRYFACHLIKKLRICNWCDELLNLCIAKLAPRKIVFFSVIKLTKLISEHIVRQFTCTYTAETRQANADDTRSISDAGRLMAATSIVGCKVSVDLFLLVTVTRLLVSVAG